jgi:hypothetical protein
MSHCPLLAWEGCGGREFPRTRHGSTSRPYIVELNREALWKERLDVTKEIKKLWKKRMSGSANSRVSLAESEWRCDISCCRKGAGDMADDTATHADGLEALARRRFSWLSEAERRLVRAAPKAPPEDNFALCGPNGKDGDPANNPSRAYGWGKDRRIRAELIRWLCVDQEASQKVDPRGVRVYAAMITQKLDLSFATVRFPLFLYRCRLADGVDLKYVTVPALSFWGSSVGSLHADGANVREGVFLSGGFFANGTVRLVGAQIGGSLECGHGTFKNAGGDALFADRVEVRGGIFLNDGFSADGGVKLIEAKIGGSLECSGTFNNRDGEALSADGAEIKGDVFLGDGFSAVGEVRLLAAKIGGDLDCNGGTFKSESGDALSADSSEIAGAVFLSKRFSAQGAVRLFGAQIAGNLECGGGKFSSMQLDTAAVRGTFFWDKVQDASGTQLNLTNAMVGAILDDQASWPERGNLFLDGFVYARFSARSPTDAPTRLEWLNRQEKFTPQPYRQLAKVMREMGDDEGEKRVLFELEERIRAEDRKRLVCEPARWLRVSEDSLSDATVGYGIYPRRAIWCLCGLTALGWIVHRRAKRVGAMAPTDKDAYAEFHESGGKTPARYQPFNPLIYSLENCIPLVKLGQDERWQPDPSPQPRAATTAPAAGRRARLKNLLLVRLPDRATSPMALRWFRWIMIGLGWLLATFFVAGLSGIIKVG